MKLISSALGDFKRNLKLAFDAKSRSCMGNVLYSHPFWHLRAPFDLMADGQERFGLRKFDNELCI